MTRATYRRWSDAEHALLRGLWHLPCLTNEDIATFLKRKRGPVERVARERLGLMPRVTIRIKRRRGELAA